MSEQETSEPGTRGRVIGLDLHPDVFTAAALSGSDAAQATVRQLWDRVATVQLETWGQRLLPTDVVVIEATGNTFNAAERLQRCGVKVVVLESRRAGQIRTTYCANDRVDAVKLARVYLSGLAHVVWKPDERTRERREVLHHYQRAVTDAVRARNRLKSFLSDHGVRLRAGVRLTQKSGRAVVLESGAWTACQRLLLEEMLATLGSAHERRQRLAAFMAAEVMQDPTLFRLLQLVGVRHVIAFAIGAVVGDVTRFANPKKLVAYIGLTPRVQISGNQTRGPQGLCASVGRPELRALLMQAAQNAMQQRSSPLHTWGWKLCLRKGHKNVAIAAVARKLLVSVWYCLRGFVTVPQRLTTTIATKLRKITVAIGRTTLRQWGYASSQTFIQEKTQLLMSPT